ncbi:hypothetical protein F2Q69_00016917 [Brassica cretica]|uniref:Uncharacterized protein n=1 Tax=Brassica cretica TaxID=69181 RepID=A0A8S9QSD9_BRACR|nr:hypothetical protein F2Q69_00016917 [Brassica cretica]
MSSLPNTAQIISELEYELEGSINVCPWLDHGPRSKERELPNLPIRFESQIMGRGVRKESYRIYRSALKVRFPCQSRLCGLFSSDRRTLGVLETDGFDASLPTWSLGGRLILIHFGANDTAFRVYNKCPQFLEPVEDALYEVINRASDAGITPLHVAAL